jgi:hypothetical protein
VSVVIPEHDRGDLLQIVLVGLHPSAKIPCFCNCENPARR